MRYFAEIDELNLVLRVLVVSEPDAERGAEYLSGDLKLGGTWIETFDDGATRKQFASAGNTYDPSFDAFLSEQPFPSWGLNENLDWQPPEAYPDQSQIEPENRLRYFWNEPTTSWVEIPQENTGE